MTWWGWIILGALLLGAELFAIDAQFYLVFLGVSAALVGVASLLGLDLPEWGQWLAFGLISLFFMFTFRKSLYEKLRKGAKGFPAAFSDGIVEIPADLAPSAEVRGEFRGTNWTIRNVGASPLSRGTKAKVRKIDGLTLHVSAE